MRPSLYSELVLFIIINHALNLWLIITIIHGLVGNITQLLQSPSIRVTCQLVGAIISHALYTGLVSILIYGLVEVVTQ